MLFAYRIILYLAFPLLLLRLLIRALRERRYFEKLPQRFGFRHGDRHHPRGGIWIHAVSVGEVNAAAPLIERILEKYSDTPVTVTTMTPTGAERVDKIFGTRVQHGYLPYDYPGAVNRFLVALQPRLGFVMETEIWPNLIAACARQKIPLMYVNVRVSARAHRGYHKVRKIIRPTLEKIPRFAVQGKTDARRLIRLGAPPESVTVTGNLKFDVVLPASIGEAAQSVRRDLGETRVVWVAGSTHEGEEAQVLRAFAQLRKDFPSLLLVLAPRHPQRFNAVSRLCIRQNFNTVPRSIVSGKITDDIDIYLADTMGELPLLIAAADVAFIGGSLVPVGGHNVLEACAAGVPVVFGKHMFNFAEIADLLLQHAAGIQVMDGDELVDVVGRLLADAHLRDQYANQGRALIEQNRGALNKIFALVEEMETQTRKKKVARKKTARKRTNSPNSD